MPGILAMAQQGPELIKYVRYYSHGGISARWVVIGLSLSMLT